MSATDPNDRRRGLKHLRVGIALSDEGSHITSLWVVDQPVIQRDVLRRALVSRVDLPGGTTLVQSFDDPQVLRGGYRKNEGHHWGRASTGTLYVSVPFTHVEQLEDLHIRLVAREDLGPLATDATTLASRFDEPGLRPRVELRTQDLRGHHDWKGVAERLGVPEPKGRFEIYVDEAGEYRWRLRGPGNQIVADSGEGFETRAQCERELQWVRAHARNAAITSLDVDPGSSD